MSLTQGPSTQPVPQVNAPGGTARRRLGPGTSVTGHHPLGQASAGIAVLVFRVPRPCGYAEFYPGPTLGFCPVRGLPVDDSLRPGSLASTEGPPGKKGVSRGWPHSRPDLRPAGGGGVAGLASVVTWICTVVFVQAH